MTCLESVIVGDSIAEGFGATINWPNRVATSFKKTFYNKSHGSTGWNYNGSGVAGGVGSLINLAASEVDPLLTTAACIPPKLVLVAGTNDIFYSGSGSTAFTNLTTYINARLAAGWTSDLIYVATILQRSGNTNAERLTYNTSVIGSGFKLIRFDLDPNIGCNTCNTNLTYFQADQTHPNNAGQQVLADVAFLALKFHMTLTWS